MIMGNSDEGYRGWPGASLGNMKDQRSRPQSLCSRRWVRALGRRRYKTRALDRPDHRVLGKNGVDDETSRGSRFSM